MADKIKKSIRVKMKGVDVSIDLDQDRAKLFDKMLRPHRKTLDDLAKM